MWKTNITCVHVPSALRVMDVKSNAGTCLRYSKLFAKTSQEPDSHYFNSLVSVEEIVMYYMQVFRAFSLTILYLLRGNHSIFVFSVLAKKEMTVITSCINGRGNIIGPVHELVRVCLFVSTLMAELFDLWPCFFLVEWLALTLILSVCYVCVCLSIHHGKRNFGQNDCT